MGMSVLSRITVAVMSILRVGLSLAIIIITAQQLYHISFYLSKDDKLLHYNAECLMAGSIRGGSVCSYAYAVCGLSLLLGFLTSILLCVTCDMCGAGTWVEVVVEGFQTAWWMIAGIVISKKVRESNEVELEGGAALPKEEWRNAVAVMTWVAALLSLLITFVYLTEAIRAVAKCCGCCGSKKDDEERGHRYKEDKGKDKARGVEHQQEQPPAPQVVGKDEPVRANAV